MKYTAWVMVEPDAFIPYWFRRLVRNAQRRGFAKLTRRDMETVRARGLCHWGRA